MWLDVLVKNKYSNFLPPLTTGARLAQSVEHQTFNLRAMGSSPISGDRYFFSFNFTLFIIYLIFLKGSSISDDLFTEVKV